MPIYAIIRVENDIQYAEKVYLQGQSTKYKNLREFLRAALRETGYRGTV